MSQGMVIFGILVLISILIIIVLVRNSQRSGSKQNKVWKEQVKRGEFAAIDNNQPVCDVCSKPVNLAECYELTGEQVVTKEAYWVFAFTHQWAYVHQMYPNGDVIASVAQTQAGQSTGWMLCESCSKMFSFDKEAAKRYALQVMQHIPGGGPADVNRTALAAAKAWKSLYGSYPSSIRLE